MARKKNYLNNKDMLEQIKLSREQDQMTDELAKMMMMLAHRFASRPNFAGYSYVEDMEAYAVMQIVKTWRSFNPDKYDNPFAFFTQCVKNSFFQYLKKEKKQREIKDMELVFAGMDPSLTYLLDYEEKSQ